ncbi:MAG: sodium:panthothenate symporter [Lentisphaeria bacterium]
MHWIDWMIVCIPLIVVLGIGLKSQKYIKGVSDFLTAGRVAGRYVVCVANGEAGMGLISLVAMYEAMYHSGFAYGFWNSIAAPIGIVMGLTGYCTYRFRETRAMTMGQFLEIRYNRPFRIVAAFLQSISGILNYSLFPAVGARFLVYFCDLPLQVNICGMIFPTFGLVMALLLGLAVWVVCMGGQITIMVTDCVQGLLSYPMYAILVGYIIWHFSWFHDLAPILLDRPVGKSMLNPFDISNLRDFNLFFVAVGIFGGIIGRMSWSGTQGYNAAAKDAHEQKMGGILGTWRAGFSSMMFILLAVVAYTFLNSPAFVTGDVGSAACRNALAQKAFDDVASDSTFDPIREEYRHYLATGKITPALQNSLNSVREPSNNTSASVTEKPVDKEPMLTIGRDAIRSVSPQKAQVFGTIFGQMRVPMALKYILPIGMVGVFCALGIFLMISTDTTYLHSWGSILVQDIILPLRGKPFTPIQQIRLLRIMIASVAAFAFCFSMFFGQVDYILMFFAITGAIWTGGAGIVIVGGLYWKRGTTAGAFCALLIGSGIATCGAICQSIWAGTIYPMLGRNGWLEGFTRVVEMASHPLEPYILWRVVPTKFPINSQEIALASMLLSIAIYVVVSLLSRHEVFNIERMLHRGKYQREGKKIEHGIKNVHDFFRKLIGINDEYTRGDKIITWSVFIWSFCWSFCGTFLGVIIWNAFSPWPMHWWVTWFFFNQIILSGVVAVVSTLWFSWGGTRDLIRMFRALDQKQVNVLDDGRVMDNVSADDIELVEKIDHIHIEDK